MPYTMKVEGMEDLTAMLQTVSEKAQGIAALALYDGAGIVADAINKEARSIKTAPFKYAKNGSTRLPSPEEKAIVTGEEAAGIAKFDKDGNYVGTAVGYSQSGYVPVNWNHMSNAARTNYKAVLFKGHTNTASSTLKFMRENGGGKDTGRGAQNTKPIAVVANAINSGTSFMQKQPFIRKAVNRSKTKAQEAIENRIAELVDNALHKGA